MKNKIFILISFLTINFGLSSQTTFSKAYNSNFYNFFSDCVPFFGFNRNAAAKTILDENNVITLSQTKSLILNIDTLLNFKWHKYYYSNLFNQNKINIVRINKNANNIVIIANAVQSNSVECGIIALISNTSGNVVWSKKVDSIHFYNTYIANQSVYANGYIENPTQEFTNYIFRLDLNGNVLNKKVITRSKVGPPFNYYKGAIKDAIALSDSLHHIFVIENGLFRSALICMDNNLNIQWKKSYTQLHAVNSSSNDDYLSLKSINGSFIVNFNINGSNTSQSPILKFDNNGNVTNTLSVEGYSGLGPVMAVEATNNNLIIVTNELNNDKSLYTKMDANFNYTGTKLFYRCGSPNNENGKRLSYFNKSKFCLFFPINNLDMDGSSTNCYSNLASSNILFQRSDYNFTNCMFVPIPNNTYTFVLTPSDTTIFEFTTTKNLTNFTLQTKDSTAIYFNYVQNVCNSTSGINDSETLTTDITLFPVPATTKLQIHNLNYSLQITIVNIFNALGELVVIQKLSSNEINVENLKEGIYFIELFDNKKHLTTKKFIKQ